MATPAKEWANWLRGVQSARGWTASRLAIELSVHQSRVSEWMSGRYNPTINTVLHAAQTVGADEIDLLARTGHKDIAAWARELRNPDTARHHEDATKRRKVAAERADLVADVLDSLASITSVLDDRRDDLRGLRAELVNEGGGSQQDKDVSPRVSAKTNRARGA